MAIFKYQLLQIDMRLTAQENSNIDEKLQFKDNISNKKHITAPLYPPLIFQYIQDG